MRTPRWACRSPPAAQGSEASPAARNTLDSARIPRASKLLICGSISKGPSFGTGRDATLPGGDLDQNVLAGYAAVALALILDISGGLFSDAARPCQRPAPPLWRKRGTRKSRLETKTENEASSALLARLW